MKFFFIIVFIFSLNISFAQKNKNLDLKFTYTYSEALKLKFDENYDKALDLFYECLKFNPYSSATLYQISLIYTQRKEYDTALEFINRAIQIVPDNQWYLLQRIDIASKIDDNTIYEQTYILLHQYFPDNADYSFKLALFYYNRQNYGRALEIIDSISDMRSSFQQIALLRYNIYYQTKRFHLMFDILNQLIALYPNHPRYYDFLANYYLSVQKPDQAIETYKEALLKFPDNKLLALGAAQLYTRFHNFKQAYPLVLQSIGLKEVDPNEFFIFINQFLKSQEITVEQKTLLYQKLIEFYPDRSFYQTEFINFLVHQDKDMAQNQIIDLLDKHPDNFDLWLVLIELYREQENYPLLRKTAQQALSYFPNQSIFYFYSAYALYYLGEYKDAIDLFQNGLNYIGDDARLELRYYLYLALCYHEIADDLHSDKYFDMYFASVTTDGDAMYYYATYLSTDSRDLDKALYYSERSLEIEPLNPRYLDTYAWILYLRKDYKNALFYIKKAYKYGGYDDLLVCQHYADILLENKDIEKAKEIIRHALKLTPANSSLKQKLYQLENQ